ncbi:MAG: hypothetical protein ACOY82_12915 [Pseudomonadota bacterium]
MRDRHDRPDGQGAPQPLVLSWLAHDVHAAAVCWALRHSGFHPIWAKTLADTAMASVSLHADDRDGLRFAGGIASGRTSSVWFRRPRLPDAFPGAAPADVDFLRDEWKRHVANVHAVAASADDVFWVNRPDRAAAAENKLLQLRVAHACGLRFPATLVSSDPTEIRAFFASHERVVYKPYATHSWRDGEGRIYSTYARVVDADALRDDASLRLCPGIYQACVRKRHDLRVTVVGERMFAVRVDTPETDDGVVDWRASAIDDRARSRAVPLPAAMETTLRRLMDALGLAFGCIDLVVDERDDLHFLEINQAGQFLFVEHDVPKLPLLRAMTAMLAQARADYALDAIPETLTYAAFLDDPEQMAWWDSVSGGIRGADGSIPGVSEE